MDQQIEKALESAHKRLLTLNRALRLMDERLAEGYEVDLKSLYSLRDAIKEAYDEYDQLVEAFVELNNVTD